MHENWAVWAIGAAVSGLVSYFTTTGTINSRLSTLEANVQTLNQLAEESREDIKQLLRGRRNG